LDDSSNKIISGQYVFDRDNGGVLVIPSGTSFPSEPEPKELFWRTDENKLYRRNDGDTAWDALTSAVSLHGSTHENGGSDEISVAGLSGLLADNQNPTSHASSHQNGGGDEISVAGLSGELADDQPPKAHAIDGAKHTGSLAHSALSGITATDHHNNANDPTSDEKAALGNAPNALSSSNPVTDKSYVDALVEGLQWLAPVKDKDTLTPPGDPDTGDRYLIDGTGTGAWSGHDGEVAEYNGSGWDFTEPTDGTTVNVQDEDTPYTQTEASSPWVWVQSGGATAIHGNEKHSPSMLTVGSNRSDTNLDILTDGDQDDDVDQFHLHIRRDKSKMYFWDDFIGSDFLVWWVTNVSGTGSLVSIPQGEYIGGQALIRSGNGVGRNATLGWDSQYYVSAGKHLMFEGRLKIYNTTVGAYTEIGFGNWSSGAEVIYFSRDGSSNWYANTVSGGNSTSQDTGVATDTNWHIFKIDCISANEVKFYIDGVLKTTITTNIPTVGLQSFTYQETTSTGANRDLLLDWIELVGDRA